MATISFTIPDTFLPKVIAAICYAYDYDNNKLVGETQSQFSKRMIINKIKLMVKEAEQARLGNIADATATTAYEAAISEIATLPLDTIE